MAQQRACEVLDVWPLLHLVAKFRIVCQNVLEPMAKLFPWAFPDRQLSCSLLISQQTPKASWLAQTPVHTITLTVPRLWVTSFRCGSFWWLWYCSTVNTFSSVKSIRQCFPLQKRHNIAFDFCQRQSFLRSDRVCTRSSLNGTRSNVFVMIVHTESQLTFSFFAIRHIDR